MIEHEVRGYITEDEFNKKLIEFENKYGHPKREKRIAIRVGALYDYNINLRIRITNGKAEIVEKIRGRNSEKREELIVEISNDLENIYNTFLILRNLILDSIKKSSTIMQFDNYLFNSDEIEIKLAHQTGNLHKYVFEIESKKEGVNLEKVCSEMNLIPNMKEMRNEDWAKWEKELNIDVDSLTVKELKELIKSYL